MHQYFDTSRVILLYFALISEHRDKSWCGCSSSKYYSTLNYLNFDDAFNDGLYYIVFARGLLLDWYENIGTGKHF